jgi:hypothetical protein
MRNFGKGMWRRVYDYERVFLPSFMNLHQEQVTQEQQKKTNMKQPILVKVFYSQNNKVDFTTIPPNRELQLFLQSERIYDIFLQDLVMNEEESKYILRQKKYLFRNISIKNIFFTIDYTSLNIEPLNIEPLNFS